MFKHDYAIDLIVAGKLTFKEILKKSQYVI